ncbi:MULTISPECIES: hypothetical protein [Niastella]|uniref:Uncharacterized protein n=1 Tax=Niastella soli TaxID=2821487 RepID=A0ABS3YWX9_9BACT|nr:hypothetical protein [Niastella soli]MBO9201910.1 hypothetical protein [Niastella soli]
MLTTKFKKYKPLKVTIVKELRDYSNDPMVLRKAEEAKEFIKKAGIPEDFKQKKL